MAVLFVCVCVLGGCGSTHPWGVNSVTQTQLGADPAPTKTRVFRRNLGSKLPPKGVKIVTFWSKKRKSFVKKKKLGRRNGQVGPSSPPGLSQEMPGSRGNCTQMLRNVTFSTKNDHVPEEIAVQNCLRRGSKLSPFVAFWNQNGAAVLPACHKKCQPQEEIAPRCSEMSRFQLYMTTFLKESRFRPASEGSPKRGAEGRFGTKTEQQSSRLVTRNANLKRKLLPDAPKCRVFNST